MKLKKNENDDINVTIHQGIEGLFTIRDSWNEICDAMQKRSFYHEWAWYKAYMSTLNNNPSQIFFVLIKSPKQSISIIPLEYRHKKNHLGTLKILQFPEHNHIPLYDIICRPEFSIDTLFNSLISGLKNLKIHWDLLQFNQLPDNSKVTNLGSVYKLNFKITQIKTCYQIDCKVPWENYFATLSQNHRSNLNKARNKLCNENNVIFELVDKKEQLNKLFYEFLKVEASGWKGRQGTAIQNSLHLTNFYQNLIDNFSELGHVMIGRVAIGEKTIASQFCLRDSDTLYLLKMGYDESYSKFSPGHTLLEWNIRNIYHTFGIRYLNVVGNPSWFWQWKPQSIPIWEVVVYNFTVKASLIYISLILRNFVKKILNYLS